ncbi:SDR family oxidoreductase [cf. Phormidesmis sp. LEGE 11477]|nr:SDR family oxidoreductase [cf. Phormidesmis sp. LEGE 11477]
MNGHNQHAIITGGSSGIGKAIARQLAEQGANISIISRSQDRLRSAKAEIEQARQSARQSVVTVVGDVSDRSQAEQAIQTAIEQLGPPHLLVTSAGIARPGHFQALPIDAFAEAMSTNYFGTLYCIRAVLPVMEQQQAGHLCLISSAAGLVGLYGYSAYGPSKFAVRGLAESLRAELKPIGIGVSVVYPPDTQTPQLIEENKTKPAATKAITATAKPWTADDVAQLILKGIQQNRFEISPGTEIKVLTRLHSLIAPLLNRYFDGIIARHPRQ